MVRTKVGGRRWVALIVALILCGSPALAIVLNDSLAGWSFISFELRNIFFLILILFVFGVASETRPFRIGETEARDGYFVFAAIILIGWFLMLLKGWVYGFLVNLIPLAFFLIPVGIFHAGRWVGRIPRHKLPQETAEGRAAAAPRLYSAS